MTQVDDLLDAGVFLDDISARLALHNPPVHIHRSSIFRHKKLHYLPRLRLRALEKKSNKGGRILVEWPEDLLMFGLLSGRITNSDDGAFAGPVTSADIVLTISFEECQWKPAHNQVDRVNLKPEEPPAEQKQTIV